MDTGTVQILRQKRDLPDRFQIKIHPVRTVKRSRIIQQFSLILPVSGCHLPRSVFSVFPEQSLSYGPHTVVKICFENPVFPDVRLLPRFRGPSEPACGDPLSFLFISIPVTESDPESSFSEFGRILPENFFIRPVLPQLNSVQKLAQKLFLFPGKKTVRSGTFQKLQIAAALTRSQENRPAVVIQALRLPGTRRPFQKSFVIPVLLPGQIDGRRQSVDTESKSREGKGSGAENLQAGFLPPSLPAKPGQGTAEGRGCLKTLLRRFPEAAFHDLLQILPAARDPASGKDPAVMLSAQHPVDRRAERVNIRPAVHRHFSRSGRIFSPFVLFRRGISVGSEASQLRSPFPGGAEIHQLDHAVRAPDQIRGFDIEMADRIRPALQIAERFRQLLCHIQYLSFLKDRSVLQKRIQAFSPYVFHHKTDTVLFPQQIDNFRKMGVVHMFHHVKLMAGLSVLFICPDYLDSPEESRMDMQSKVDAPFRPAAEFSDYPVFSRKDASLFQPSSPPQKFCSWISPYETAIH